MYHLTSDGPRECKATVRSCPYKGDHFESFEHAEEAYAKAFDFNSQKKLYAPAKSGIVTPTIVQVKLILEELRKGYPNIPVLKGDLVAHSQFGSVSYNLDHTESDNDLIFLVGEKAKKDFQNIDSANQDVKISSIYSFSQAYLDGNHFNVDVIHSGAFQIAQDQEWAPFIGGLRFNEYKYLDKLRNLSAIFATNANSSRNDSKKSLKLIKTSLRNEVLANRFQREDRVRSLFTDEERESFYRSLNSLNKDFVSSDDTYTLVQRAAREVS